MPFYDFRCRSCGEINELFLRDGDVSSATCPDCESGEMEKLLSSFNTARSLKRPHGLTCCGRDERCDAPPSGGSCCSS